MSTPKQLYLVESFWPGVTTAGAHAAARRLQEAAIGHAAAVRHLRSGLIPDDEVVWSVVEAGSRDAVIAVTIRARYPVDRISETIVVGGKRQ
ncbi:MAG: hypothetical protein M3Y40_02970 [Chloroflexota bacterium]|nr:hypothetical protein [Chloroflexota bacterium]